MTPNELRKRWSAVPVWSYARDEFSAKYTPLLIDLWEAAESSIFTFRDCDCPDCKRVVTALKALEEV